MSLSRDRPFRRTPQGSSSEHTKLALTHAARIMLMSACAGAALVWAEHMLICPPNGRPGI